MRANWLSISFLSFSSISTLAMPNILCMRSAKCTVSFCACRMAISGVCITPLLMKCNVVGSLSSSFFSGRSLQTIFSIWGIRPMSRAVLRMLKQVWNMASTTGMRSVCPDMDGS